MEEILLKDKTFSDAWRTFLAHTPDLVFIKNTQLVYLGASKTFAEMTGLSDPSEVVGKTDIDLFADKELAERYIKDDKTLLANGVPLENYLEPIPSKDGIQRWSLTSKYIIHDESGKAVALYGIGRDVTEQTRSRLDYAQEVEHMMKLPDGAMAAALLDMNTGNVVRIVSRIPGDEDRINAKTLNELRESLVTTVAEDENVRLFFSTFTEPVVRKMYSQGRRGLTLEYLRTLPDGAQRWVRDEARFLTDPENNHLMAAFLLSDIDAEKSRQLTLARSAEIDGMTGLFNHDAAISNIERFLQDEGATLKHALFIIDIDNFKTVNDTMGHLRGDECITDISAAIRDTFRNTDIIGRVGGDEFMVLMKDIKDVDVVRQRADELLDALQYVYSGGGSSIELTSSVGISIYSSDRKSLNQLMTEADMALYHAKRAGKNQYAFAHKEMKELIDKTESSFTQSRSVQLRALLEYMAGGVILCDVDDDIHITYTSPSFFKMLKVNSKHIAGRGKNLFDEVHREDLPKLRQALFELADNGGTMDHIYRVMDEDSGISWRFARGVRLPVDEHGVRKLIIVITDITELKIKA